MQPSFKVGDVVRVVSVKDKNLGLADISRLPVGSIHTVREVNGAGAIDVDGTGSWFPCRFELVPPLSMPPEPATPTQPDALETFKQRLIDLIDKVPRDAVCQAYALGRIRGLCETKEK